MRPLVFKLSIFLKLLIYQLFSKKTKLIDDETYNKLIFAITFWRKANFDEPRTFNEFICARKVRRDEYDLWRYTDKYEVREYVEKTIGKKYLNECYAVYDNVDEIDFEKLPNSFAMKCTHGSGYNIVVTDKTQLNKQQVIKKFKKWLKINFYYFGREKNYYLIKPRIYCDKYLTSKEYDGLPEIKVFCFGGKAKLISYNLCINGKTYTSMFDSEWKLLNIKRGYEQISGIKKPENAEKIINVAEKLAEKFDFVRVDLYNVDNNIIFSELTFHSGGGFVPFDPPEYDLEFAKYFKELEKPI